jgi:hypothetical protein
MGRVFPPVMGSNGNDQYCKLAKEINGTKLAVILDNEHRRVSKVYYDDFNNALALVFTDGSEWKSPNEIHPTLLPAVHAAKNIRVIHHENGHYTTKPEAEYELRFG